MTVLIPYVILFGILAVVGFYFASERAPGASIAHEARSAEPHDGTACPP